ncbi:putative cilia- and flagella-associated protein 57 [Blattamonas nauphoetae]|uniref:Cilia- and flagella-associated protein 57 n=1 Tax=Blattamonas nauphoetae TaxID=2049346 RepID=A0ABQ9YFY1_9EUKA|nr:putative cilia- and flagella-associated protein 57 [Blattamonas nauphoetae]
MASSGSIFHHKATISPVHAFGISRHINDDLFYVDNEKLIFPVGKHYALYKHHQRSMAFIQEGDKGKNSTQTAITLSMDRKYFAVGELTEDDSSSGVSNSNLTQAALAATSSAPLPQISVYNVQTQKKIRTIARPPDVGDSSICCVAFSGDSKHCAACCTGPDYSLILWHWNQPLRVLGVAKQASQVSHISFHPLENSQLALSGPKLLKVYRWSENILKQFNLISGRRDPPNFTAHLWVDDTERIIAATDKGDLCIYDRGELHLTLISVLGNGIGITAMERWQNGFAVAGEHGKITLFEPSTDVQELYRIKTQLTVPRDFSITSLTVAPNSMQLAAVLNNSQICLANLSILGTVSEKDQESTLYDFVSNGFHAGSIVGLSAATRKPICVTCGVDGWVRIWNYIEMKCELAVQFDSETRSVSIHPSGFHLVVSCGDRVKLMNIMPTALETLKEIPFPQHSGCQEVQFSHGGSIFACAHAKTISIYRTYSGDCLGVLRGHIAPIRVMSFSESDRFLYSAGMDGALYQWNLEASNEPFRREHEHVLSGCNYSGIVAGDRQVAVCGSDLMLREVVDGQVTVEFQTGPITKRLTQLAIIPGNLALVCGMASGGIRFYAWPITETFARDTTKTDSQVVPVCDEYIAHSGQVTRVAITGDGLILLTAGDDGVLFVWAIQPIDFGKVRPVKLPDLSTFWDANLISRTELENQSQKIGALHNKIKELNFQSESQLARKEKSWTEKVETQKRDYEELLSQKQALIKSLEVQVHESKVKFDQKVTELEEQHLQAMDDLEKVYEHDVQLRQTTIKKLQEQKEEQQVKYDSMITQMQEQFNWKEDKIKQHYLAIDQQNQKAFEGLREEMKMLADKYETALQQQEEEGENELLTVKQAHKEELEKERERMKVMDTQILSLQTQLRQATNIVEPLKQEKNDLERRQLEAKATVEQLRNDLKNQDVRMNEHEDTITNKETMILRLKRENQELDKFKFVLEFKIRELEKTIQPKNEQIAALEEQIQDMDAELEREHRRSTTAQLELKEKEMRARAMLQENKQLKQKVMTQGRLIDNFKHDLQAAINTETSEWKEAFKQVYFTYVTNDDNLDMQKKSGSQADDQKAQEFSRQREFLERSVTTLKHSLDQSKHRGKAEVQGKLDENIRLIEEINELRKEKREQQMKIQELKKDILTLKTQQQRMTIQTQSRKSTQRIDSMQSTQHILGDGTRQPSYKGTLHHGSAKETQLALEQRSKVQELLQLMDWNTREMKEQQDEIVQLRGFVAALVERTESGTLEDMQQIAEMGKNLLRPRDPNPQSSFGGDSFMSNTLSSTTANATLPPRSRTQLSNYSASPGIVRGGSNDGRSQSSMASYPSKGGPPSRLPAIQTKASTPPTSSRPSSRHSQPPPSPNADVTRLPPV